MLCFRAGKRRILLCLSFLSLFLLHFVDHFCLILFLRIASVFSSFLIHSSCCSSFRVRACVSTTISTKPNSMDHLYSFWSVNDEKRGHSEIQEDQNWKIAASKLALVDQMRVKFEKIRPISIEKNLKQSKAPKKGKPDEASKGEVLNQKLQAFVKFDELNHKISMGGNILNSSTPVLGNSVTEKRFKSLPPAETLPRTDTLGGYIFVCNNDTMAEDLKRQLFGLPQRYRDSVRAIQPGLPLFLYNYTTHQLHGVYEASSFGGSNIDPTAWEDKKCKGESRFPAQVRIRVRRVSKPLEEDSFRPVLHHYDGPKFRLQLSVPETLALLDLFSESSAI